MMHFCLFLLCVGVFAFFVKFICLETSGEFVLSYTI